MACTYDMHVCAPFFAQDNLQRTRVNMAEVAGTLPPRLQVRTLTWMLVQACLPVTGPWCLHAAACCQDSCALQRSEKQLC